MKIIGQTIINGETYDIHAIPSHRGYPRYPYVFGLCRNCGAKQATSAQGKPYCSRTCWLLVDDRNVKDLQALVHQVYGVEMVQITKTNSRGEMYQVLPDITDLFGGMTKVDGRKLYQLIKNDKAKAKERLTELGIKFK